MPFSRTRARRAELRHEAFKRPTVTLKSRFIRRAAAASLVMPFTLRLRRLYEGGPGDDVLELAWDHGAVSWPLDGTEPPAQPVTSNLDGSLSYEWDYGADTTGYSQLGTVETIIGGGISMTGSGFRIADQDAAGCSSLAALDATGMALTSAGARFGTLNPFSGDVSGTIGLRTAIRTAATPCGGGTSATAVAETTADDPPLPVAFAGRFQVSPGVTTDGRMRLGLLRIDAATMPQRTTFGLIHACADPAAPDGCGRRAFPVRTRIVSLVAEVLLGDAMPPPPAIPEPAPAAAPQPDPATQPPPADSTAPPPADSTAPPAAGSDPVAP